MHTKTSYYTKPLSYIIVRLVVILYVVLGSNNECVYVSFYVGAVNKRFNSISAWNEAKSAANQWDLDAKRRRILIYL